MKEFWTSIRQVLQFRLRRLRKYRIEKEWNLWFGRLQSGEAYLFCRIVFSTGLFLQKKFMDNEGV